MSTLCHHNTTGTHPMDSIHHLEIMHVGHVHDPPLHMRTGAVGLAMHLFNHTGTGSYDNHKAEKCFSCHLE